MKTERVKQGSRQRIGIALVVALLMVGAGGLTTVGIRRQFFRDRALIAAIKRHDAAAVAASLDQGADPNARDTSEFPSTTGVILRYRLFGGRNAAAPQEAALLLAIDLKARNGEESAEVPIVSALLNHGAQIDCRDKDGNTLLQLAATFDHIALVRLLLERGAAVEVRDSRGATPLFESSPQATELLLAHHASVNAKNHAGQTPLMWAVIEEADANVKLLLRNGADVNARDRGGKTALDYAEEHGNRDCVRLLTQAGASAEHGKRSSPTDH